MCLVSDWENFSLKIIGLVGSEMDSLDLDDAMMRRKIAIQRIMDLRNRLKRDNIPAKIEEVLNCFDSMAKKFGIWLWGPLISC